MCGLLGLPVLFYLLQPAWFRQLNQRGVAVIVFGNLNDERSFERCRAAGANAVRA